MAPKDDLGRRGEQVATEYLTAAGMEILARNWRCPEGEIDIVAREGGVLVAVEVRTRSSRSHGTAFESVTQEKVIRLRRLVARFRREHPENFDAVRVDVIALERFADDFSIRHERGVN
jgi:putative endonuclease